MTGKNIFITGATGFIGEKLALELAEKNRVLALVRPGSVERAQRLVKNGVEIITGDLLSADYAESLEGVDYVFHLAALFRLDAPKSELYRHNVSGTEKLLDACVDKKVKKIIYFSTAYIAGTKEKELITEEEPYPPRFKNWYEWSKAKGERAALAVNKRCGLPIVIIRPVIVYGPGSIYGFYAALSMISKGRLWMMPGDGKNKVHLVHVDDVVAAAIHLAGLETNAAGAYHVCDDFPYTCSELINFICRRLGAKPPSIILPRPLVKFAARLPGSKLFLGGIPPQFLDYFLYNQTYANAKLRSTGFSLKYPSLSAGWKTMERAD